MKNLNQSKAVIEVLEQLYAKEYVSNTIAIGSVTHKMVLDDEILSVAGVGKGVVTYTADEVESFCHQFIKAVKSTIMKHGIPEQFCGLEVVVANIVLLQHLDKRHTEAEGFIREIMFKAVIGGLTSGNVEHRLQRNWYRPYWSRGSLSECFHEFEKCHTSYIVEICRLVDETAARIFKCDSIEKIIEGVSFLIDLTMRNAFNVRYIKRRYFMEEFVELYRLIDTSPVVETGFAMHKL